jgi:AGCS family alanine or glycine:cation symporter
VIWDFADLMNGLMAIPNIVAVLLLSRIVVEETKKYAGKHIDDVDAAEVEVLKNADKGVIG